MKRGTGVVLPIEVRLGMGVCSYNISVSQHRWDKGLSLMYNP